MNQATVPRWSTTELLEGCARAGYGGVGLWRHRLEGEDLTLLARHAARCDLQVSSLCRGGFFLAPDPVDQARRTADNRRAVDEAAEIGAAALVLVCGPAPDRDLRSARLAVTEAVTDLAAYAGDAGVALAVEPMNPLYCADRSVVVTLDQALAVAEVAARNGGGTVGVVLDSYHLWWDPRLEDLARDAAGHVLAVQLADWVIPLTDMLNGRGMPGEGAIDFPAFQDVVASTGYAGLDEVEVFNPAVWDRGPAEVLEAAAQWYSTSWCTAYPAPSGAGPARPGA